MSEIISTMPCPFCGSTYAGKVEVTYGDKVKHKGYRLRCCMCDAQTGISSTDEGLKHYWERRVVLPEVVPTLDAKNAMRYRYWRDAYAASGLRPFLPQHPGEVTPKSIWGHLAFGDITRDAWIVATPDARSYMVDAAIDSLLPQGDGQS